MLENPYFSVRLRSEKAMHDIAAPLHYVKYVALVAVDLKLVLHQLLYKSTRC